MFYNLCINSTLRFNIGAVCGIIFLAFGLGVQASEPNFSLSLDSEKVSRSIVRADVDSEGSGTREGLFGLLDSRSIYGKDWFPEPLRADEADVDNELAFKYFH